MKNRVHASIAVMLLVAALYLLYAAYRTVEGKTVQQLNTRQAIHAEQAILSIHASFNHDLQVLSSLADNAHLREMDDQGRILMDQLYNTHREDVSAVTRISRDGDITYTSPLVQRVIGKNVLHQKHNAPDIFRSNRTVVSDVFRAVQGYYAVAVHVPVTHDGVFYGRLSILLPFKTITKKYLSTIKVGETGHAWLVGRDGTILYHPVEGYVGRQAREVFRDSPEVLALVEKMTSGKSGMIQYPYHGRVVDTVYRPIDLGSTLWSLAVTTPREEVLAITEDFRNQWVLIMIILVAAFALYGYGSMQDQRALARRAADLAAANESLQQALAEVKSLSGLLPICASCKKVRDDSGYWYQVESYIERHSDAQFSHSLCPECEKKLYGGEDWYQPLNRGKKNQEEH